MKNIVRSCLFVFVVTIIYAGAAGTAWASTRLTAVLSNTQQVPPNASTAKGYGSVVLSDDQSTITVNFGFSGLTGGNATAAHIHTGPVGSNGPVTFDFGGVTPNAASGVIPQQSFLISPSQVTALLSNGMYFNIHNAAFPGGEIRAQIVAPSCATAGPIEVESTSGTANATPTAYATLKAAFDAINLGTAHTEAINVEVCGDTTETAAAVINEGTAAPSSFTALSIYPAGGAARTISGNIAGHLIDINGTDGMTIEGSNAGGNSLTISNTSTGTGSSTIRLANDASNNKVVNGTILGASGASASTGLGVVFFGTGSTTGNDNNAISGNNISSNSGGNPISGIYSAGTSASVDNSGNIVSGNNISDFFNANGINAGININSASSGWTITGNKIFQTGTRTFLTANTHSGIQVLAGTGYSVNSNTVGFASAGGTGVYTMAGTIATRFIGINLTVGTGTTSSVQGNTVAGIALATSSGAATANGIICGINVTGAGNADIGTTTPNVIGSTTAVNSIVATATTTGGLVVGVNSSTTGMVNIVNNTIGGLSSSGTTAAIAGSINGINISGVAGSLTITGNTIGNAVADNMRGGTSGLTTGSSLVAGIAFPSSPAGTVSVSGNTIQNLSSFGSAAAGYARGILTSTTTSLTTTFLITNNSIHDLKSNSALQGASSGNNAVSGIQHVAGVGSDISRNTIFNLSELNAGTGGYVVSGITLGASTVVSTATTTCSRNSISALSNAGTGTSASLPPIISGITIRSGVGTMSVTNNFVALGSAITTNTTIVGIWGNHGTTPNPVDNIYHNTVNITGSPAAGALPSFGFVRGDFTATAAKTPTVDIRNNIFSVTRSGGTSKNYAIGENFGASSQSSIGWGPNASNYNVLFGTAATIGYWTTDQTFSGWQTASAGDGNSISADPLLASATNLHLTTTSPARNIGFNLGSVTNDYDGENRPGSNALFDIGADEFDGVAPVPNDVKASAFVTPLSGDVRGSGSPFAVLASFSNAGTSAQTNVTVRYRILDAGAAEIYNQTVVIASIAPTATTTVTFPNAMIPSNGTYTIKARSELAGDTVPANDEITGTITVQTPLAGNYNVGAGGNFTSLTNPGGIFDTLNNIGASAPVTINITSDLTGESGSVALNELASGASVMIKPSGSARTISGSSGVGIIRLNGADNVTIDGSLTGASATGVGGTASIRNLTVQNTSPAATGGAVIAIMQGANSANNDTVKNVNVMGQDPTQTLVGIHIGGNTVGLPPVSVANNNIVIDNCSFKRSVLGIYDTGVGISAQATGNIISHNDMSATGVDRLRRGGIFVVNQNGIQVFENKVGGIVGDESVDSVGIGIGASSISTTTTTSGGISNSVITRNLVSGVTNVNTSGFSAAGIVIAGDVGQNIVSNNMISGVSSPATSGDLTAGIFVAGVTGSNTALYYNSVSMTGDRGTVASQIGSYCLAITGTDPTVTLKDNIFYTTQTSGGGVNAKSYAIGTAAVTVVNLTSDFNDFVSTGANAAGFRTGSLDATGIDYVDLPAWKTGTSKDASSVALIPSFVDPLINLHLLGTSPVRNIGTPISGITTDIDNQARPNPADGLAVKDDNARARPEGAVAQVDMGADEFYLATAANVSISGRVTTADGRGITNLMVTVSGGSMQQPVTVLTGRSGAYTLPDLEAGQAYIVTVAARRYTFSNPSRVISLVDNVTDADFVADPH